MAKHNMGFGVGFNVNDGGAGWFVSSEGMDEYKRHVSLMGRWRAYLFFARMLYVSLRNTHATCTTGKEPKWKRLKGWCP